MNHETNLSIGGGVEIEVSPLVTEPLVVFKLLNHPFSFCLNLTSTEAKALAAALTKAAKGVKGG